MGHTGTNGVNGHHHLAETRPLMCRGVRGAISVTENNSDAIVAATKELMGVIAAANNIHPDDVASIFFTTTSDLTAIYPALAVRQLGWYDVAMLCGHEMDVPGGKSGIIRVLLHWNTHKTPQEIRHCYLREAVVLRPDWQQRPVSQEALPC
ncbi:MAG: chorismate mutase [Chloroflexi bacterium]|nr:chorismate mutase [Chloroflexota bacterium]MBP8059580.1 chorismate mutase [Chloroflexota bacterium]